MRHVTERLACRTWWAAQLMGFGVLNIARNLVLSGVGILGHGLLVIGMLLSALMLAGGWALERAVRIVHAPARPRDARRARRRSICEHVTSRRLDNCCRCGADL